MSAKSLSLVLALAVVAGASVRAGDELEKRATWKSPSAQEVKAQVDRWLASQNVDQQTEAEVEAMWSETREAASPSELLERVVATVGLVDPSARELVALCRAEQPPLPVQSFQLLQDADRAALVRNNLRLWYGRWLAQHALYDESLQQIGDLKPEDVVDPAALLFYQSVGYHCLLDKQKCLPAIAKLLENKGAIPRRYETVAILMESDLKPVKTDSLDEIARLMDDIERRLGFGRAGRRVRKKEDDVVAKLDKMIEELEKQQKQMQQSGAAGGQQATQPMQDSMPGGGSGPGEVEQKRIGSRADWGNLPPKQRQEALQQISKDLPAHYRAVIEEYFRKLARDGND